MKKILLMAAALLSLAACEEKVEPNQEPKPEPIPDEITITPEKKSFGKDGGSQDVIVTSSDKWSLKSEETYDWIEPSVTEGEDGDIVKFTAKENYTGKQLSAEFTFTCGEAQAKFTAISESGEVNFLTLTSAEKIDLKYTAKEATVELNTNLNYRAINVEVAAEAKDWCTFSFPQEAGENKVNLIFNLQENSGEQVREAVITLTGERVEPVTVTLSQRPQSKISTDKTEYLFLPDGGSIDVAVTSNVEYTFEVTDGADWIKHSQKEPSVETITAEASKEKRSGVITITEKNPYPGDEAVKLEIIVRQAPKALVSRAIDMKGMRLRPSWEDGAKGSKFENFTIELLLNADELTKQISSVLGIEGYWLVRFGDNGIEPNHLHLAGGQVAANDKNGQMLSADKIISDKMVLKTKQWYHLAVTLEMDGQMLHSARSLVKIYVDGELLASGRTYNNPLDLASRFSDSWDPWGPKRHRFYFGYSWDNARDFIGKMTEIRIWNKALTSADLKAENHFYQVDSKAEGLVAYWKFNEAKLTSVEGFNQMCIPDETGNNYHLICETLQGEDWNYKVEPKFVDVNLPE